ncbi:unnamed protein product [Microthlaspi erraticum]|uniref:Uncharacterized protein n=1 Tax=Microthlaspi erraticum TaxID=1685480 RepID=A0A6D2HPB6_9BRAS|nr:unnamed protein product [Microthlaspi erraticum]
MEDDDNNYTPSQPKPPVDSNARQEEQPFQIGNTPRSPDFFALPQHHAPSPFGSFPPPPTQDNRASSSYSYGPTRLFGHDRQ